MIANISFKVEVQPDERLIDILHGIFKDNLNLYLTVEYAEQPFSEYKLVD